MSGASTPGLQAGGAQQDSNRCPPLSETFQDTLQTSQCCSPITTAHQGTCTVVDCGGWSEELEGGSPTSERSTSVGLTGSHASRVAAPKKGALRWVLRQLTRKPQRHQQQPQPAEGEPLQTDQPGLMLLGSSYDSLVSLEEHAVLAGPDSHQLQQQLPAGPSHTAAEPHLAPTGLTYTEQQQQQLSSSEQPVTDQAGQPINQQSDGLLRRAVKCVLRPVVRAVCGAVRAIANSAGPQGPGNNDHSVAERVVNVLTSLPFFAVGLHGLRNRRCPKGRHFALSFLALGAVASGYHGADRTSWLRPIMRKLDYYTICYTSTVLRRAAHIPLPPVVAAAAVVVAPIKPTLVTGLNLLLVEGKFLRSALAHTHLRSSLKAHLGTAAVGMACFAYEDVATGAGWPPVLHSLWHCLSAAAMGCLHGFLEHLELAVLVEGWQLEAAGQQGN